MKINNWKLILTMALPMVISFGTQTIAGTLNLMMVGSLGAATIAVVGVSNVIIYNAYALFSGIGNSLNYMVAQNKGEQDMMTAITRTYSAIAITIAASILLVLTGQFAGPLLTVMGSSEGMLEDGAVYLLLRFVSLAVALVTIAMHAFYRGLGDTKTPMWITMLNYGAMVIVTFLLVYGKFGCPRMGLAGAGIGILAGELVALACTIVLFCRKLKQYDRETRKMRVSYKESRLLLTESSKLGLMELSMSAAMLVFTVIVMQLGENALAANEIGLNVMSLGMMPAAAFGATAAILIGQEIGKGAALHAKQIGSDVAKLGFLMLLVIGLLEFLFADQIASYYAPNSEEVSKTAAELIRISAFLQCFDGAFNLYAGGLRGRGDTSFLMRTVLLLSWCLFVPAAYIFTILLDLGSIGTWAALYLYLILLGVAMMLRYYRSSWSSISLIRFEQENLKL